MRHLTLLTGLALATQAVAAERPPIGTETAISFAAGGGLRDWKRTGPNSDVLFVRDRTEQWYQVTLAGPCRSLLSTDALSYTTNSIGQFDRFSTVSVSSIPEQVCGVKSIRTSLPPEGRQGYRPKR